MFNMEYIDIFESYLINIPIVGKAIAAIIAIYAINEIINKITLEKINPLSKLASFIPVFGRSYRYSIRKKYYKTLETQEFIMWEYDVLKKIYKEHNFTNILSVDYPIVCYETAAICRYPFEKIYNKADLDTNMNTEFKISSRIEKEYSKIVREQIKRPGLPGFMLKKLKLDENNKIISFSANTGTYEQNVYTSHILEYELYKAFVSKKINLSLLDSDNILELLPLRNNIHKGKTESEVLTTGTGRKSLIGVQMLVLYKYEHSSKNQYKILFIKRSEDVAAKPGFYQFVPSGGFEIFENEQAINNMDMLPYVLKNNYSLDKALFRELVEEIFGEDEFIHNINGVPSDNILANEHVLSIIEMISKKEASFEFLGSTIDLVGLRHELSFILRIDNCDFSKKSFKPNHESSNIETCLISEIEEIGINKKLNQGSAGLLYLAKKNHLFKEVENN